MMYRAYRNLGYFYGDRCVFHSTATTAINKVNTCESIWFIKQQYFRNRMKQKIKEQNVLLVLFGKLKGTDFQICGTSKFQMY